MGNMLLIVCLIGLSGAGFWVMGKFDRFLEKNYHETGPEEPAGEPLLRIALEDPAWIGSLLDALEKSSRQEKGAPVSLYSGDFLQIKTALKSGRIELGIIEEEPETIGEEQYQTMKIPGRKSRILAEEPGLFVAALRTKKWRTETESSGAPALAGRIPAEKAAKAAVPRAAVPAREAGCFVTVLWNPAYPSGTRDAMLGMLKDCAFRKTGR